MFYPKLNNQEHLSMQTLCDLMIFDLNKGHEISPPTWNLSEDMLTSWPVCLSRFSSCDTTTCPSCVR